MSADAAESAGWPESAGAWITALGEAGDFGRRYVLDAPMSERVRALAAGNALDVGCGEGRFCRMLRDWGFTAVGIDPTEDLLRCARERDPHGDYRLGRAERLEFADATFDLVVSYLSLVDIADVARAIGEMARVLRPAGRLLIANLTSFSTAGNPPGWNQAAGGAARFSIDRYLEERAEWVSWRGIRIRNWHRPLATYMTLLLDAGLDLRHFAEPAPSGGDPAVAERYRRVPYFHTMEWERRPATSIARR